MPSKFCLVMDAPDEPVPQASVITYDIMHGLKDQYENQLFCNYTIETSDDVVFHVHKCCIAAVSSYFSAMLSGTMVESRSGTVKLRNVAASGLRPILNYVYGGSNLELTEKNVGEVLNAASMLQITTIISHCIKFLISKLDEDNVVEMLTFCKMYDLPTLSTKVDMLIMEMMKKYGAGTQPILGQLPLHDFAKYLKKCEQSTEHWNKFTEREVWDLAFRWIHEDIEKRKCDADTLLMSVKLPLLLPCEIEEMEESLDHLVDVPAFQTWLREMKDFNSKPAYERVVDDGHPHWKEDLGECCLVVMGSTKENGPVDKMMYLETTSDNFPDSVWYEMPVKPFPFTGNIQVVAVNNCIMVYDCVMKESFLFDPRSLAWESIGMIPNGFQSLTLLTHQEHVVSIGGYNEKPMGNIVLKYCFGANIWTEVATLPHKMVDIAACSFQGSLYISGSKSESTPSYDPGRSSSVYSQAFCKVEFLGIDDKLNDWSNSTRVDSLPNVPSCYQAHHLVPWNGDIYAFPDVTSTPLAPINIYTKPHHDKWDCWLGCTCRYEWQTCSAERSREFKQKMPDTMEDVIMHEYTLFYVGTCLPKLKGNRLVRCLYGSHYSHRSGSTLCNIPDGIFNTTSCALRLPTSYKRSTNRIQHVSIQNTPCKYNTGPSSQNDQQVQGNIQLTLYDYCDIPS